MSQPKEYINLNDEEVLTLRLALGNFINTQEQAIKFEPTSEQAKARYQTATRLFEQARKAGEYSYANRDQATIRMALDCYLNKLEAGIGGPRDNALFLECSIARRLVRKIQKNVLGPTLQI